MDKELYDKRRMRANELLLQALEKVNPDEDDSGIYADIAQLYRELNNDIKTEMDYHQKAEELKIEKLKIETEAKTKAAAIDAEKERTQSEAQSEKTKAVIDIVGKVAMAAGTIFAAGSQIWMFKRSTAKESDEALLTQTDQTIVRNGLSGRFFK